MRIPFFIPIVFACSSATGLCDVPGFQEKAVVFFEERCVDCHDADTKKGGLDLTKIDPTMLTQPDLWTRIHDRVQSGEMPPKKKERPTKEEIDGLLGWIAPRLGEVDRAKREVVLRRLNRAEYENTIRDLLGVEMDVSGILPEDQKAGGFDNIGSALAVSTEQMEAYLKAASSSVDRVLKIGEKPVTQKIIADPVPGVLDFITKYPSVSWGIVGDMAASYKSERSTYSQLSSREKSTTKPGIYRFKFQAKALNTTEDIVFSVRTNQRPGGLDGNLGYFEVGPELKTFEIESEVSAYSNIQIFPLGLPFELAKVKDPKYPGLAIGKIEMTGPIAKVWPPEPYAKLLGGIDPQKATVADGQVIIEKFLPRAFRRPVEPVEIDRYASVVSRELEAGRDFISSLRTGLLAVLCSPNFLYLREDARPEVTKISDAELASRLSYFLWSSMPDDELRGLAAEKKLSDPAVLKSQVERLLNDPRSGQLVKNFTGQWLHLRAINDTTPDAKVYPDFDELLQVGMVEEGESFFRENLEKNLPISNFLTSDFAMVNERLAKHYGIEGVEGIAFRKVKLPADSVRGGVMTQAGVLKVTANGTTTSPIVRGTWVLENILGKPSPPPPPNINAIEPDIRGAVTIRQQLEKHRGDTSCSACHQYIDPPGFALESFDPTGSFRKKYVRYEIRDEAKGTGELVDGADVDPSGELSDGRTFEDILGFKKLLMTSQDDFARCLTRKLLTYGLGRELGFSDRAAVETIDRKVAAEGNGLRSLIHAITQSEIFSTR